MALFLGEGATIGSEAGLGPQYIDCTVNGQNLALVDMANRHATVFPLINHLIVSRLLSIAEYAEHTG